MFESALQFICNGFFGESSLLPCTLKLLSQVCHLIKIFNNVREIVAVVGSKY